MPDRRMEIEAKLLCRKCNAYPFTLYRVETRPDSGIWTNTLWPASPDVPPPIGEALCPTCRGALVRVAP